MPHPFSPPLLFSWVGCTAPLRMPLPGGTGRSGARTRVRGSNRARTWMKCIQELPHISSHLCPSVVLPGKNFTEGWVEFEDKRVAKRVAEQLNGQPIGGKKRSAYYFDLW